MDFLKHLYTISYQTSEEYRGCLRRLFQMDCSGLVIDESVDAETRDEWTYDDDASGLFMDRVYDATKDHPLFQELYDLGAACMISTDREIGLAVLFSYDYLDAFYPCLLDYLDAPSKFDETNSSFIEAKRRLIPSK